jgi:uncharacterized small protein (DUF1192 family)
MVVAMGRVLLLVFRGLLSGSVSDTSSASVDFTRGGNAMVFNPDDLEPKRPVPKAQDLEIMSIEGLEEHIQALEAEIARTREVIARKKAALAGAESFFKTS